VSRETAPSEAMRARECRGRSEYERAKRRCNYPNGRILRDATLRSMNSAADPLESFPATLKRGTGAHAQTYRRATAWFASREESDHAPVVSLQTDTGTRLHVYRINAHRARTMPTAAEPISAVYEDPVSGAIVVPTGRVSIRFAASIRAETMRTEIERAGYIMVSVPSYALNAAWVEDIAGSIAQALAHLDCLEHIAGIENVEPQLLAERVAK
jgi:hypothetical protein